MSLAARGAPFLRAGALLGARDGAAWAALLAMTATFATIPFFVSIALAARLLDDPEILWAAERAVFALWPKAIARPVADAIAAASDTLAPSALPAMLAAFLVLAANALDVLRRALERFYAPDLPAAGPVRARLRAAAWIAVASALGFAAAVIVAATTDLPSTAPAMVPDTPRPGAGPFLFAAQTAFGLALLTGSLVLAHTRLAREGPSARAAWPGIGVSVVVWFASVNLLALWQSEIAPPTALYGPFAAAFATLLFFFVGALAILYGAALNVTIAKAR